MLYADIAVIGAGPAGMVAAYEAAKTGSRVILIDESLEPGGQLMKQIHKFFGSKDHLAGVRGLNIGKELYQDLLSLKVQVLLDTVVWGSFQGKLAIAKNNGESEMVQASKIIVATGASENTLSFPGWTLPGVMGAGAAQTMMNIHRVLPGRRILMVGAGNVGLIVSYQLLQAGAEVVALIEAAPKIGGYQVHEAKIKRAGVPILTSHTIKEAIGDEKVQGAVITELNDQWEHIPGTQKEYEVDTICLAVGLTPLTEMLWLMDCEMSYESILGGFIPKHDDSMETSIPGVYVAGDITGIEEASVAMEEGRIAGLSASLSLGKISEDDAMKRKAKAIKNLEQLRSGPFAPRNREGDVKPPPFHKVKRSASIQNLESMPLKGAGAHPVVDCYEEIPCNPCEAACPMGCIRIGEEITHLPTLHLEECTGCGLCVMSCPGLAIFLVDLKYSDDEAAITIPYELLPLPEKGERVDALDYNGENVCTGTIKSIVQSKKSDSTPLITILVPKEFGRVVRHFKRRV